MKIKITKKKKVQETLWGREIGVKARNISYSQTWVTFLYLDNRIAAFLQVKEWIVYYDYRIPVLLLLLNIQDGINNFF